MYGGPSLPFMHNARSAKVLLLAQFANFAALLLQVISLFAFAFGVNVCMGFTTNRFRRSEEWDEGPVSGIVTDINCTSPYTLMLQTVVRNHSYAVTVVWLFLFPLGYGEE